ncbi:MULTISPECIES: DUF928 domain-containing protein [Pseudanabaena]|uniref:DUF928 domain-containing protein n=2 Tax=Pseudanabaena TaxID=1152 RepID=L8N4U2_9CYAN|nr:MULTISPECIES: DUF928 domain-containing protein [Pseudanabaena]ELS34164.1 protein of unknown function DUF928 [Pseudanabaena biceps PCC 7429]MDG3493637.1 DUF928 domain-containing protein [Pseudanabaena catenata USMAC16]
MSIFFYALFAVLESSNAQPISPSIIIAQQSTNSTTSTTSTGKTHPTGDRGDCPILVAGVPQLTALTAKNGQTATLSQSPVFRFYTPYAKGNYQFRLSKSRKSNTLIYSQNIARTDQAGIFTVSLPVIDEIKPRVNYFWELEYFCSNKPNPDSRIVNGWVYQDRLTPEQMLELNNATTTSDRIIFYQKYGIWLELLDEIAKSLPQNQSLWQQVLTNEGLGSIINQPIFKPQSLVKP